jgi:hypothetical protein
VKKHGGDLQPLSVREGAREPGGPYEGAPPHLLGMLISWIDDDAIGHGSWHHRMLRHIITYAHAQVPYSPDGWITARRLLASCAKDEELCLNVVDAYLLLADPDDSHPDKTISADNLRLILAAGGSVWTVSPNNRSLQRAVDSQTQAAFELATSSADVASSELREAWANTYGRSPDPSDAWDHSIKAVEAALRPIVCPNHTRATLANVIGELRTGQWKLNVRGRARDNSIQPLIQNLELLWPDPNQHGSPTPELPATREEAAAVVQLAVVIVQWARDGQIIRKK